MFTVTKDLSKKQLVQEVSALLHMDAAGALALLHAIDDR